ncbi:MAG: hypothetical protein V3T70_05670 [Phycisphaerae bacterium]
MHRAVLGLVVLVGSAGVMAGEAESWPADYYRAHYLATVQDNPAEAATLYEKVYRNGKLSAEQRDAVRRRLDAVQEQVVAQNLASLCPPNTVAYVEINQPGQFVERLTSMLGIETKDILPLLADRKPAGDINWDHLNPAAFIPDEIAMSPALARWLGAFRGIALAMTGLQQVGEHDMIGTGVLILNPGDADLMRGLLEMAAQFAPAAEPVGGYPAFQFPHGVVGAMTERLVVVGMPRSEVEGVIERLKNGGKDSLAESEAYHTLAGKKHGATLFGFVDAQRALAIAKPFVEDDDDFQIAHALMDLDNLVGAAFAVGAIDGGLGLDASVLLNEGHHNVAYNLIRTPAMSRRSLACVPGNAAFVLGFGLNPANGESGPRADGKGSKLAAVTGLDIFRELFGNIEEISLYVAPMQGGLFGSSGGAPDHIPNGALIIAAGNADKSEALWTQLLSIPSMAMPDEVQEPEEIKIAGHDVTAFPLPEVGAVYVGKVNNCLVVSARKEAMAAVFKTAKNGRSVLKDDALQPVISRMNKDVGMLGIIHAGRVAQVAAVLAPAMSGGDGPPPGVVNMILPTLTKSMNSTVLYFGLTQSETEANLRICLAGLPNVNELLKQVGPMTKALAGMQESHRREVVQRAPKPALASGSQLE